MQEPAPFGTVRAGMPSKRREVPDNVRRRVGPSSFLDAAKTVLRDAGRPMAADQLVDEAIRRGLVRTNGKTPKASMTARLYTYVLRQPSGEIRKVAEPGRLRSQRGSVRWLYVGREPSHVGKRRNPEANATEPS